MAVWTSRHRGREDPVAETDFGAARRLPRGLGFRELGAGTPRGSSLGMRRRGLARS